MTCNDTLERISAVLDGEATLEEKAQLDRHLDACESCRALFDDLSALHAACGGLEAAAPPELKKKIMSALPAQVRPRKVVAIRWKRWGAMAASFALVALAAWQLPRSFQKTPAADGLPPKNREAVVADMAVTTGGPEAGDSYGADDAEKSLKISTDHDVPPECTGGDFDETEKLFQSDAATLSLEGSDAVADRAANGGAESAVPAPASLPDYLEGDPVNVNAAVPAQGVGGASSRKSAKVEMGAEQAVEDADQLGSTMRVAAFSLPELTMAFDCVEDAAPTSEVVPDAAAPSPEPVPQEENGMAPVLFAQKIAPAYCGVLTIEGGLALNVVPAQIQENGETRYELSPTNFFLLVQELTDSGIEFTLRLSGADVSSTAPQGLVIVLP